MTQAQKQSIRPLPTFPLPPGSSDRTHRHRRILLVSSLSASRMTESPFLPRERLFKQQQYFQNLTKHTHLKGRYDMITSVGIPLALAASSLFMIGRGVYNMSHGIGKEE